MSRERPNLVERIAAVFPYVVEEAKPKYLSMDVQTLVAAGEFDKAARYIALEVLAYIGPAIVAGRIEHGPKGECPDPELCSILIEGRISAGEAETAEPRHARLREDVLHHPAND